ncbi:MAG: ankyrin repeat domain-containing protein [Planctomycetes bacterium]|nr:ankyrin repeat domain-containing protein [Planctomycetota bacterium]
MNTADPTFAAVLVQLRNGDFSALAAHFAATPGFPSRISEWSARGLFDNHPAEAAEALTCACFLGERATAECLLQRGLDPSGGNGTGMNAVHWAANRGELATLRLLLERRVPLEVLNNYGSTVLGQTIWSAIHQPRPGQHEAIAELIRAGADIKAVERPTGDPRIDDLLRGADRDRGPT